MGKSIQMPHGGSLPSQNYLNSVAPFKLREKSLQIIMCGEKQRNLYDEQQWIILVYE